MPTYCDCEKLQKRIEELEAKLREVPWTEEEADAFYKSLDECDQYGCDLTIQWAEKRIRERGL